MLGTPSRSRWTRLAALLVLVYACVWSVDIARRPDWAPDGFAFLHSAVMVTGVPSAAAERVAGDFYLANTPSGRDARYRHFYVEPLRDLENFERIAGVRAGYTVPAGVLYPVFGPRALLAVSILGYIGACLAMLWLALAFVPLPYAVAAAVVFGALPLVRGLAAEPLVDMLALAWWIASLGALVRYASTGQNRWIVAFAAASVALNLTRPAVYLTAAVAIAAVGVILADRRPARAQRSLLVVAALALTIVSFAVASVAAHAASFSEHTAWMAQRAVELGGPALPPMQWFADAVRSTLRYEAAVIVKSPRVVLVAAAVAGLVLSRRATAWIPAAGAASAVCAIVLNPVPWAIARTFDAPCVPVLIVGVLLLVEAAVARMPGYRAQPRLESTRP